MTTIRRISLRESSQERAQTFHYVISACHSYHFALNVLQDTFEYLRNTQPVRRLLVMGAEDAAIPSIDSMTAGEKVLKNNEKVSLLAVCHRLEGMRRLHMECGLRWVQPLRDFLLTVRDGKEENSKAKRIKLRKVDNKLKCISH